MIDLTLPTNDNAPNAQERWAHMDRLGSVVAMSDTSGEVLEQYRYSPYGVPGWEGPAGFPFRFTGQKLDPETGLYYYKARYYDPETGRFLQTDPIGYEDQQNMYAYVGNDPVNGYDPTGLADENGDREQDEKKPNWDSVCNGTISAASCGTFEFGSSDGVSESITIDQNAGRNQNSSSSELFVSTEKLVEPDLLVDAGILLSDPDLYLRCSARCAGEISGAQTVLGGALAFAGQNVIPTRGKFKTATKDTSLASIAARKALGKSRSPVPLPAPTTRLPFGTTRNVGKAVGRLTPLTGYAIWINDARNLDFCVASCLRPPELEHHDGNR